MVSYRLVVLFIVLISFRVECTLRCACTKDLRTCTSILNMQVDFRTAQQICMEKGGTLLMPSSETIDSLLFNKTGHFWIGAESNCLSSTGNSRGDTVTLNGGGEDVACSLKCMSVSSKGTLTERSCEEQVDGFLCDGIQWETCWEDRPSEVQILNKNETCELGPCEHFCEEIVGGHMCSCFKRYRPKITNPEHCEYYCDSVPCLRLCPTCECPEGFVKDETQCVDFDECKSNLNNCEQKCSNTFGSYKCSCYEGFMLVNKSKCVPLINPTTLTTGLVTPSVNYTISHAAFATPAKYIGLTLFIILAISAVIGFLYYLQKRKSDLLLTDSDVPDDITVKKA